ncbi:MAG: BNR-4 repeat-containing protein [Thermoplasmata archaeon]|nr:MAG: BNR-4 repeat-containing protein [Thermoplasmata archaeon]
MNEKVNAKKGLALAITYFMLFSAIMVIFYAIPETARADPPFSANKKVSIESGTDNQNRPSIVVGPNGNIYIAWEDYRNTHGDIFFANSTDGGATWSNPNKKINTDATTEDQMAPSLAVNATGTLFIAWEDNRAGNADIYFANSTDGGATWGSTNLPVNTDGGPFPQEKPVIAVDSNGVVYAVWHDARSGTNWDIYSAYSSDGGATWNHPNVEVSNDTTNSFQLNPTIAVDSNGIIYSAWEDQRDGDSDIYFAKSEDGGMTWSKPNKRVNTYATDNESYNPSIAVDSNDNVYLVWEDNRDGNLDIYFARSSDKGETWPYPNVKINTDVGTRSQWVPDITVDSTGTIHVAWGDYRNDNFDIFYANSSDYGVTWTDPNLRVNDDISGENQLNPDLAVSPNGTVCVAWDDRRSGSNDDIYYAYLIPPPPIPQTDKIIISLSSNAATGWVGDQTYFITDIITLYACGWNETYGVFVSLVEVDWKCNDTGVGTVDFGPSTSTTFTAVGGGICYVNATNASYEVNETGILTVLDITIDEIRISLDMDGAGGWIGDRTYTKHDNDIFYACGWNKTSDVFVKLVDVTWSCNDTDVGGVTPSGTSTTFTAKDVGICHVNATSLSYGLNTTGTLTINALGMDKLIISLSEDSSDGWIGDQTYKKYENDTFYACGWNNTHDEFVALVDVEWNSNDELIGTVVQGPDFSTKFEAVNVGTCNVSAYHAMFDINYTGVLTVDPLEIDEILISLTPDGSSGWIDDRSYVKHDSEIYYACGWNKTHDEFAVLVDVTWTSDDENVGEVAVGSGTTTTFNAVGVGTCKVSASHASYATNRTGILTVDPLVIDDIVISLAPNGSTGWIGDYIYDMTATDTFYACGWNKTHDEFVELVDVNWKSNDTGIGSVEIGPANSTAFNAVATGKCMVNATHATYGVNWTGVLTVVPLKIDRIFISRSPDGLSGWIGDYYFVKGGTDTFYACGWNETYDVFVELVEVNWASNNTSVGTLDPLVGSGSSVFTAVDDGVCNVSASHASYTTNWTGILSVSSFGIDRIIISRSPNCASGWVGDQLYYKYDSDTFYACGWNETDSQFVILIEVVWECNNPDVGTVNSGPSTFTTFDAEKAGVCKVSASNILYDLNWTGILTVNPLVIDRILISDTPDGSGGWIGDSYYIGGLNYIFYACGWNDTHDEFVSLVAVEWQSDDTDTGVVTLYGHWTNFTAKMISVDSQCKVNATYDDKMNATGTLTVLVPTVDEIIIRNADGGGGEIITDKVYIVNQTEILFAAAYNKTVGYLRNVIATWEISDNSVGIIETTISPPKFIARLVIEDSICKINVTYLDIRNSTGDLLVLAPRVDEIIIRDAANGEGNITTTRTFSGGETDQFYAAAYNNTAFYLWDVEVTWSVDDTSVGEVTPLGIWTNFTVKELATEGTCRITATYSPTLSNSTGIITVSASVDTIKPAAPAKPSLKVKGSDKIEISWSKVDDPDVANYRVYRRKSPDDPWEMVHEGDADTTSYTDSDLSPDTTYYYAITAVDDAGNESPYSTAASAKTEEEESQWILILGLAFLAIVILLILSLRRKKKTEVAIPPEEGEGEVEQSDEGIGEEDYEEYEGGTSEEEMYEEYEDGMSEEVEERPSPPPPP